MGENLKVKFWADMPENPMNIPGNKVAEIRHVADGETIESPWLALTRDEYINWETTVATKRASLRQYIKDRAYALEVAGMEIDGVHIATGRDDQAMLSGAVNFLALNPEATIDWQSASGAFVTLNKAQVEAIASAVGAHVQAHFTRRKELNELLDATDDRNLDAFRATVTQFWES